MATLMPADAYKRGNAKLIGLHEKYPSFFEVSNAKTPAAIFEMTLG